MLIEWLYLSISASTGQDVSVPIKNGHSVAVSAHRSKLFRLGHVPDGHASRAVTDRQDVALGNPKKDSNFITLFQEQILLDF